MATVMTFDEVYEGASNSVLIKNFSSGDFGVFLEGSTQFRVPDMYVESMSRFANGNILVVGKAPEEGGRDDTLLSGSNPQHLYYRVYGPQWQVVKDRTRLVTVQALDRGVEYDNAAYGYPGVHRYVVERVFTPNSAVLNSGNAFDLRRAQHQ